MALTILQKPVKLLLSEQAAVFKLETDYTDPCRIIGRITGEGGDSLVPDAKHQVIFELSDYLRGQITLRGKTSDSVSAYSNVPKQVTFTFEEYYDGQVEDDLVSDPFYILDGKVPGRMRKVFYTAYGSVLNYLETSKSCLTWWPATEPKRVLTAQKEFLNYLQVKSSSPVNLKLNIALLLNDGTVVEGPAQSTFNNVAYMTLMYFPVGYTQLGIPAFMATNHPTKTVERYSVVVLSGSTPYSLVYSFAPDTTYHHKTRELWIRNSFGLYEVLLCTGSGIQETENKPETVSTDGISHPNKLTWKNTRSDQVKVNTGYLSAAQAQWLADLLDTTEACELINGVLHPIILNDSVITPVHDGDHLFMGEIEYEYAYNEPIEIHA